MGEQISDFLRPGTGTGSFSRKKKGWFMGWMAVMRWKLERRVRGRRKVLCFQILAYGAGRRVDGEENFCTTHFISKWWKLCCKKKKKKNSLEGICKSALLHTLESFIFRLIDLRFPQSYRLWSSRPLYRSFCRFFSLMFYAPHPTEAHLIHLKSIVLFCFFISYLKPQLIRKRMCILFFLVFFKRFSHFCSLMCCSMILLLLIARAWLPFLNFLGKWPAVEKEKKNKNFLKRHVDDLTI